MYLYIYFICQLYALLRANAEEVPSSPCPEVFQYVLVARPRDSKYMGVRGVITFPFENPVSINVTLHLPVFLHEDYNGGLQRQHGNSPNVIYHMDFQKNLPIPSVVSIVLNGRLLCYSAPALRGEYSILYWYNNFKLFGPYLKNHHGKEVKTDQKGYETESKEISHNPDIPVAPEIPRSPKIQGLRKQIIPWKIPGFENCGLAYPRKQLIVGGTSMQKGDGPWMVPLYKRHISELKFTCTSTLISTEYVMTAAHCVWNGGKIDRNKYIAYVGLFNIYEWRNEKSQRREISKLNIHPQYEGEVDYDLAILKLTEEVSLTNFVNPICIWSFEGDLRHVEGRKASVFGWGKSSPNDNFTETPHSIDVPIVSQDTCRESNYQFKTLTSSRTLCAGSRNGKGPCNGDSGGGLLLPMKDERSRRRWVLRGITSSALSNAENDCDLRNYVIFVDVAKYKDWILGFIVKG